MADRAEMHKLTGRKGGLSTAVRAYQNKGQRVPVDLANKLAEASQKVDSLMESTSFTSNSDLRSNSDKKAKQSGDAAHTLKSIVAPEVTSDVVAKDIVFNDSAGESFGRTTTGHIFTADNDNEYEFPSTPPTSTTPCSLSARLEASPTPAARTRNREARRPVISNFAELSSRSPQEAPVVPVSALQTSGLVCSLAQASMPDPRGSTKKGVMGSFLREHSINDQGSYFCKYCSRKFSATSNNSIKRHLDEGHGCVINSTTSDVAVGNKQKRKRERSVSNVDGTTELSTRRDRIDIEEANFEETEGHSISNILSSPVADGTKNPSARRDRVDDETEGQSISNIRNSPIADGTTNPSARRGQIDFEEANREGMEGHSINSTPGSPTAHGSTNPSARKDRIDVEEPGMEGMEGHSISNTLSSPNADGMTNLSARRDQMDVDGSSLGGAEGYSINDALSSLVAESQYGSENLSLALPHGESNTVQLSSPDLATLQPGLRLDSVALDTVLGRFNRHPSVVPITPSFRVHSTHPFLGQKNVIMAASMIIVPYYHSRLSHWSIFAARKTHGITVIHYDSLGLHVNHLSSARASVTEYLRRLHCDSDLQIRHKQAICAQQDSTDSINSGVFAIENVRALLDLHPVPDSIDAEAIETLRKEYLGLCRRRPQFEPVRRSHNLDEGLFNVRYRLENVLGQLRQQARVPYQESLRARIWLSETLAEIKQGSYGVEDLVKACGAKEELATIASASRRLPQRESDLWHAAGMLPMQSILTTANWHSELQDSKILKSVRLLSLRAMLLISFRRHITCFGALKMKMDKIQRDFAKLDGLELLHHQVKFEYESSGEG